MNDTEDKFLELGLAEVLGQRQPPDLIRQALARLDATPTTARHVGDVPDTDDMPQNEPQTAAASKSAVKPLRERFAIWAAAACFVVGIGLIVWPQDSSVRGVVPLTAGDEKQPAESTAKTAPKEETPKNIVGDKPQIPLAPPDTERRVPSSPAVGDKPQIPLDPRINTGRPLAPKIVRNVAEIRALPDDVTFVTGEGLDDAALFELGAGKLEPDPRNPGVARLSEQPRLAKLTELRLDNPESGADGPRAKEHTFTATGMAALERLPIEKLHLARCRNLGDAMLEAVANGKWAWTLTELFIERTGMSGISATSPDKGWEAFRLYPCKLRILNASGHTMTPGFKEFLDYMGHQATQPLESLLLRNCNLVDSDLSVIGGINGLKYLDLTGNEKLTSVGIENMTAPIWRQTDKGLSSLTGLALARCWHIHEGFREDKDSPTGKVGCSKETFSRLALLQGLASLDLYQTYVEDWHLEVIADLPALQTLVLRDCEHISDDGLAHLVGMESLRDVDLFMDDVGHWGHYWPSASGRRRELTYHGVVEFCQSLPVGNPAQGTPKSWVTLPMGSRYSLGQELPYWCLLGKTGFAAGDATEPECHIITNMEQYRSVQERALSGEKPDDRDRSCQILFDNIDDDPCFDFKSEFVVAILSGGVCDDMYVEDVRESATAYHVRINTWFGSLPRGAYHGRSDKPMRGERGLYGFFVLPRPRDGRPVVIEADPSLGFIDRTRPQGFANRGGWPEVGHLDAGTDFDFKANPPIRLLRQWSGADSKHNESRAAWEKEQGGESGSSRHSQTQSADGIPYLITSPEQWRGLWKWHAPGAEPHAIDFSKELVVVYFAPSTFARMTDIKLNDILTARADDWRMADKPWPVIRLTVPSIDGDGGAAEQSHPYCFLVFEKRAAGPSAGRLEISTEDKRAWKALDFASTPLNSIK